MDRPDRGWLAPAFPWLAAALLMVPFMAFPALDTGIEAWFYRAGSGFPAAGSAFYRFVMRALPVLVIGAALAAAGLAALGARRGRLVWGLTPRHGWYLVIALALGPGLVVNTWLKDHWGRPRPSQVQLFGGADRFVPVLETSDQCTSNCSFPSGHAALAFDSVAFALLVPPPWRRRAVWAGLAAGALVGVMRMAMGAHFPSDVVAAGIIVCAIAAATKQVVVGRYG